MCIVRDTRLTFGAGIAVAFLHVLKKHRPINQRPGNTKRVQDAHYPQFGMDGLF